MSDHKSLGDAIDQEDVDAMGRREAKRRAILAERAELGVGPPQRRKVICLVGSTRFKQEFLEASRDEGAKGHIVLTVSWFSHVDGHCGDEITKVFQACHFDKIDMADEVVVVNPQNYIGDQTRKEIKYATLQGKPIRYRYGESK